jgi:hypothetical protein
MPNVRLIPPGGAAATATANGRAYTCAAGATIDVPDFDANVLTANGWTNAGGSGAVLATVGATAARPLTPSRGQTFLDTTLALAIVFAGKSWRNPVTGAAA